MVEVLKEAALEKLNEKVGCYGRLRVARELGWTYSTLGAKLKGFCVMTNEDLDAIVKCLDNVENL